ncbi:hypothetical protein B0H14DRAFT_2605668 [Mycena olivaceomarginata]|nr:hypothetical protein B0H14DRAFT_2605668 [Mycena olivaceomarginata]
MRWKAGSSVNGYGSCKGQQLAMAHIKQLGRRGILSILSTTQEEGRYLLTWAEGGSLENKVSSNGRDRDTQKHPGEGLAIPMNKWSGWKSSGQPEDWKCRKCRKCWRCRKPETRSRIRKPNNGTEKGRREGEGGDGPCLRDQAPADSESTGRVFGWTEVQHGDRARSRRGRREDDEGYRSNELRVQGSSGESESRVRVSDPNSRFGRSMDELGPGVILQAGCLLEGSGPGDIDGPDGRTDCAHTSVENRMDCTRTSSGGKSIGWDGSIHSPDAYESELTYGSRVPNTENCTPAQVALRGAIDEIKAAHSCVEHGGTCFIDGDLRHMEMNRFRLGMWGQAVIPPPQDLVASWNGGTSSTLSRPKPHGRSGPNLAQQAVSSSTWIPPMFFLQPWFLSWR